MVIITLRDLGIRMSCVNSHFIRSISGKYSMLQYVTQITIRIGKFSDKRSVIENRIGIREHLNKHLPHGGERISIRSFK